MLTADPDEIAQLDSSDADDACKIKGVETLFLLITGTVYNATHSTKHPKATAVQRTLVQHRDATNYAGSQFNDGAAAYAWLKSKHGVVTPATHLPSASKPIFRPS